MRSDVWKDDGDAAGRRFWKDFYWWILEEWWGAILGGKMMLYGY